SASTIRDNLSVRPRRLYSWVLWRSWRVKGEYRCAAWKGVCVHTLRVNRAEFMRLGNKQVINRSDPWSRIRPIAEALRVPRKEVIKGKRKTNFPKRHVGRANEFRPVGICVGHKITQNGNCLPECS